MTYARRRTPLNWQCLSINAPTCTGTTAKLLWSGTAFTCGTDTDTNTTYSVSPTGGIALSGTTFSLAQNGATNGQVLMWNSGTSTWTPTTPNAFTDTDAQTISYDTSTRVVTLSGGTGSATTFTLPLANGTQNDPGLLSKADWTTFNGKENILTFSDGLAEVQCRHTHGLCRQPDPAAQRWRYCLGLCYPSNRYQYNLRSRYRHLYYWRKQHHCEYRPPLPLPLVRSLQRPPPRTPPSLATSADFTQLSNQLNLADTGVTPGTYNNVTVDAKGRVTSATNVSYLTSFTEVDGIVGNEVAGVVTQRRSCHDRCRYQRESVQGRPYYYLPRQPTHEVHCGWWLGLRQ
jgi:hypothetical protein